MITMEQYMIERIPKKAFLYMPDALKWVLTHSLKDTIHGGNGMNDRANFHKELIREAMQEKTNDAEDLNKELESFEPRRRHREKDADTGNIDVERYIDGDPRPFQDVFTTNKPKPSKTIILECMAGAAERTDHVTMRQRHRHVYAETLKAEAEGTPVRVIAARCIQYHERPEPVKTYFVIKDYLDPIFPDIWSALKTSALVNSFSSLFTFTTFGTKDGGNGLPIQFEIEGDFPLDEELIVIDPRRVIPPVHAKVVNTLDPNNPSPRRPTPPRPTAPAPSYRPPSFTLKKPRFNRHRRF